MSKKSDNRQARPVVTDLSAVRISGKYWVTRSYAEIADLIGEGPIEGIVSGDYSYLASEDKTGYNSVTFSQYSATGTAGTVLPELGFLRSIYWNNVPIVDKHGYFNFQDINVEHNFGDPIGALPTLSANLGNGSDFDLSVERGIGERLFGPQVKGFDKETDKDYSPGRQGEENSQKAVLEGAIDRYAKTYTIYNKECSDLQINVKVDALYEQVLAGPKLYEKPRELKKCNVADVGYGDTKARTIVYNIYWLPLFDERFNPAREDADQEQGAFTDQWTLAKTERVEGKVDFPYIRTTSIAVGNSYKDTPGFQGYKIRIVRLTPESLSSFLTNRSFVHSIVEVYGTRLRYPYTSMVYSRFDARNFQRIPARAYDAQLLRVKVPSNYNPVCKTYGNSDAADDSTGQRTGARYNAGQAKWTAEATITNGIFWDGEFKKNSDGGFNREWTDNPAWCFYDLVTNARYGLGDYIKEADIDKWALYEIAQYCDGMVPDGFGSYEPRFSMNYIITSREEAFKVLNDLSSMFRGITYYAHGSIFAVQDKYRDPVFQFNNSNVTQGDFTYSSSSKKARHSVAIIRYNDKRDNFQPAVEYMEDEESVRKYGILELETTALGCTSKGQARRFGKWILASESEETETVQFGIGHEGGLIRPGDVVQIYDNFRSPLKRSGRTNAVIPSSITTYFGGGANTVTGNSVILDSAIEFTSNKSYNFSLLTPTFSYSSTQITDLNSSGVNEISRSQIQNLVFSGAHARVITGSYKSEYHEGGSGVCTQIHFSTGAAFGGQSNQLDFDNYVITGYTNTGVDTDHLANTVADYSGGCFSGENLIWSVEPSNTEDPEFLSGNFSNFRIINIKETDDNNYSVAALAYSTGKYDSVDSSVKIKDLSYYDVPEFPTGENNSTSAAVLSTNTSLSLSKDTPFQENIENTEYQSIKIDFDKAGYNRTETINDAGGGTNSKVEINDGLTYFVSITTTGDPNQYHATTKDNLYTIPTSDYKNIYKTNTNLIITPEDTLYTDAFRGGKITAEILITEEKDYYVTVFAANGAGRLSQGIQRKFDKVEGLIFFSAINHITVSDLTTQGITDTSTPTTPKIQQDIGNGEPGFVWTPGFETSLMNAPVDNNEGPVGPDGARGDIPTYPLEMFENDVNWRVTFRAPSVPNEPNVPNSLIYFEFTGYQSDPSWPSFVFTTDYNNPALINDLRSRTLAAGSEITGYKADGGGITYDNTVDANGKRDVGYYLVDPSGMIVKNDLNAFPLRTFDIVVEPHDKEGKTSQDHYVWSNTIYNAAGEGALNTNKGTEQFNLSSVNSKYDIFGANIPSPSGIIFAPKPMATATSAVLLGGGNNAFISPSDAYKNNHPYVASALLLADGTFFIGVQPAEDEEGSQRLSESELGEIFEGARGLLFYYTVGTSLKEASLFEVNTAKIPSFTENVPSNAQKADSQGNAFGGIVKGVPPGEMVYRGFYVFGENDSMGKISLKVPQIADNKDNVNFCGALFDTLSLARAFTIENHNVLVDSTTLTPLIFLDSDLKFNYKVSASAEYKVKENGELPKTFAPNKPINTKVFNMISQTQQCMSNQTWGQISFSLDDVLLSSDPKAKTLKDVLSYKPAGIKKEDTAYRWNRAGGDPVGFSFASPNPWGGRSTQNAPLDLLNMYLGHSYTLPMMLGNKIARGFLNEKSYEQQGELVPNYTSVHVKPNSLNWRGHVYEMRDISSSAWFIMGFGDPRGPDNNGTGLQDWTLTSAYFDLLKKNNVQSNTPFTQSTSIVDDDGAREIMTQLLDCIVSHEQDTSLNAQVLAKEGKPGNTEGDPAQGDWFSQLGEGLMYNDWVPSFPTLQAFESAPLERVGLKVQNANDGYYPFSQAWATTATDGVLGHIVPVDDVVVSATRTIYEFPLNTPAILGRSILQGISTDIKAKFKVIEIKMPDLTYMAVNPGGSRSPTGWRVRQFAYMQFTVFGDFGDPESYIVHPLEGYSGGNRTDEDDIISYDARLSVGDFGAPTRTKNKANLWSADEGGLLLLPPTLSPRLLNKTTGSFTFIIGAPADWTADAHDGMELTDWFGEEAVLQGKMENAGLSLINFGVLKSNRGTPAPPEP